MSNHVIMPDMSGLRTTIENDVMEGNSVKFEIEYNINVLNEVQDEIL